MEDEKTLVSQEVARRKAIEAEKFEKAVKDLQGILHELNVLRALWKDSPSQNTQLDYFSYRKRFAYPYDEEIGHFFQGEYSNKLYKVWATGFIQLD